MKHLLELIGIALLCGIKPIIVIPAARVAGFGFVSTLFASIVGGSIGAFVFLYLFEYIMEWWSNLFPTKKMKKKERTKPVFTKRNRLIISLVNKYGLTGIAAITPLLSIPLGTFIASRIDERFIRNKKKVLLYLCVSITVWSVLITFVSGGL